MQIEVYGTPAPQGSKRVVRGRLIDTNQQSLRDWRSLVGFACQGDNGVRIHYGPLAVTLNFYLARPKAHYGVGQERGEAEAVSAALPEREA